MEFGIALWYGYQIPLEERLKQIQDTGFSSVMLFWDRKAEKLDGTALEAQPELVQKFNLGIENIHLPFDHINDIWADSLAGEEMFLSLMEAINACGANEIPVGVLHTHRGFSPPLVNDLGINRIKKLIEAASKRGVQIALENLKSKANLDAVFSRLGRGNYGFCYDSGHDLLYNDNPYEILDQYGDRLIAIHLHDTLKDDDTHLIPGYGKINWETVREKLAKLYQKPYMLECGAVAGIEGMDSKEYLQAAYTAAKTMFDPALR